MRIRKVVENEQLYWLIHNTHNDWLIRKYYKLIIKIQRRDGDWGMGLVTLSMKYRLKRLKKREQERQARRPVLFGYVGQF